MRCVKSTAPAATVSSAVCTSAHQPQQHRERRDVQRYSNDNKDSHKTTRSVVPAHSLVRIGISSSTDKRAAGNLMMMRGLFLECTHGERAQLGWIARPMSGGMKPAVLATSTTTCRCGQAGWDSRQGIVHIMQSDNQRMLWSRTATYALSATHNAEEVGRWTPSLHRRAQHTFLSGRFWWHRRDVSSAHTARNAATNGTGFLCS
eukprot:1125967-Rhodomonas_salina.1